ncbi:hypothetical protein SAMN06295964_1333 [Aeromicrobium choanae]|uniref:4-amino-4-deoxy-L-arabinose transferase n=2 Tax=Aeromicrobium choanae TaxID=1736691 RepID=A0A1T4YXF7_9ACTN|nr:hypothetical protein SAMN06295964_1333 [Aeromicrobium choanae]
MAAQWSMLWSGWPWIIVAAALAVVGARLGQRKPSRDVEVSLRRAGSMPLWVPLAGLVAVSVLALGRERWDIWPVAVGVILLVGVQLVPWTRGRPPAEVATSVDVPGTVSHLLALSMSLGLAVLALFLLRPDADDTFYVNRATWVATHGTASRMDTMFSPGVLEPAYAGGIPMPSIEALQGVLAHALGLQAPTLCYLVAGPALAWLVGWTTWRLLRAWAPRRAGLALLVALIFLLASADSIVGNYSLGRIWQGKATAYAILLPLVWLFMTRVARGRGRRCDLVLLFVAGVAFVGLTTTSSLLAPVVGGAGLGAALLLRSPHLAKGAACFLAGPVVAGLVQMLGPAAIGGGGDNAMIAPLGAFTIAFGPHLAMTLLALAALVLAPRIITGSAAVLIGSGVVVSMVALLPGVFELADTVTGAGAVAWRLVIGLPLWVMVGLLVTWAPTGSSKALVAAVVATVLAVPLVQGRWLWDAAGASLTSGPTWKVDQDALADVRALRRLEVPRGLWQLPPTQMEVLAISTVDVQAATPRAYYLPTLQVPDAEVGDRVRLMRLEVGQPVTVTEVRTALERLNVAVACVSSGNAMARRTLSRAVGYELEPVGGMHCHVGRADA